MRWSVVEFHFSSSSLRWSLLLVDEKIYVQPIPVSMINLPGTDWVLVRTSDGKKYHYNNKTKEEALVAGTFQTRLRDVAPFSKWEKELPKIVFDPRFKAIPSYSTRRSLFEQFGKTRVDEEERKDKRDTQKAAIEGFKQLLDEASEVCLIALHKRFKASCINQTMVYTYKIELAIFNYNHES
ncbi:hypothetical protein G4B88_026408 [Cannabis sativa]|uniref:FF domain-containing protein n=1 Tax=Cannabis sativa TaxID=3483 RepID=A0A7J6G1D6_CANSA|nr:hypothetical protein G4B88_026408 [Cannabis sativa]